MSESPNKGSGAALLLASALTKIHPGAGRSPGVVDLPVVRDPLGYPYIPGSMLKGSLRSTLTLRGADENKIKCLFGPETGEETKFAGSLTFHDLYPLLIPAPSSTHGVLYVTTPALLARAAAVAEVAGYSGEPFRELAEKAVSTGKAVQVGGQGGTSRVGAFTLAIEGVEGVDLGDIIKEAESLNPLYGSVPIRTRILVVPEEKAIPVVESLLMRLTRVRINPKKKTVEHGGLWTEEYLPWGTLFLGLIVDNKFRGEKCNYSNAVDKLNGLLSDDEIALSSNGVIRLVIGGKETVGGGLVAAKIL